MTQIPIGTGDDASGTPAVHSARATLVDYITLHNEGVRTGDFARVVALFSPDAVLVFAEGHIGPFRGTAEITEAFAAYPPSDMLIVHQIIPDESHVSAVYQWQAGSGHVAGRIDAHVVDGCIVRMVIHSILFPDGHDIF